MHIYEFGFMAVRTCWNHGHNYFI